MQTMQSHNVNYAVSVGSFPGCGATVKTKSRSAYRKKLIIKLELNFMQIDST